MKPARTLRLILVFLLLVLMIACGGGGSSSSSSSVGTSQTQALTITTQSPLPATLQGHSYSATLTASGGQGALHWTISPMSPTALFVNGLSIDANSGVLSGTANFAGLAAFTATVTDSSSPPQSKSGIFNLTAFPPLAPGAPAPITLTPYTSPYVVATLSATGGVPPLTFTMAGGSMPPGLVLRPDGRLYGSAYTPGAYAFTVHIQDSFSPPELVTQQVSVQVSRPAFHLVQYLPSRLLLNRPFSGRIFTTGGLPPYSFSLSSGSSLPPGLSLDPNTGQVSGTPTTLGQYTVGVNGSDSTSARDFFRLTINVAQPLGRNDSPATATAIASGTLYGSISPFIDPPDGVPTPGDNDFYKFVSLGGATVHLETGILYSGSNNPLDTVIEIVDGNGHQYSACRQFGDSSANFNGPCMNDDVIIDTNRSQRSALDFLVPGAPDVSNTFYVHVLDWRGDARPDMLYTLSMSGAASPLGITGTTSPSGRIGPAFFQFTAAGGTGHYTWSLSSGTLPPGTSLNSYGTLLGTFSTAGSYVFTVSVSDAGPPAQTASATITFTVTP